MFARGVKLVDLEKRLDAAKTDLASAEARVAALAATEDAATETAASYAQWRSERDEALIEVGRLQRFIAALEPTVVEQRRADEVQAIRKRAAAARKANAALAERIRMEGAKLSGQMLSLVKEVAASTVEAEAINKMLPSDEPPIADANVLARGKPAIPRRIISEKIERLWVFKMTGNLIGDQDAVVVHDAETGFLPSLESGRRGGQSCVRRSFKVTAFHPAVERISPNELFRDIELPHFDRPGSAIPPRSRASAADFAALSVAPAPLVARESETQTEMTPLESWAS